MFHSGCTNLHSYQQGVSFPSFPHPHQHLFLVCWIIANLACMRWYLIVFLICISLILVMLNIFSCACWLSVCFLWKNVYSAPLLIFKLSCFGFLCWVVRVLIEYTVCKYLLSFHKLFLFYWWFPLLCKSFLIWCNSICLFFAFVSLAWGDASRKILLTLMSKSLLPRFSFREFYGFRSFT